MSIESIMRNVPIFKSLELDIVLFENQYPVLFTCKNDKDVFLFSCCLVNSKVMKWIATKTDYETLIQLLNNKITIRDAFLCVSDELFIIEYDGVAVNWFNVKKDKVPAELMPTAGEYMDAEDDEYAEEIAIFQNRQSIVEVTFALPKIQWYTLSYEKKAVRISEDFFGLENNDVKKFSGMLKKTFALG